MMKATAWFCPVLLTLLCATRLVCTAQRGGGVAGAVGAGAGAGGPGARAAAVGGSGAEVGGSSRTNGYPLEYPDARNTQDDFLLAKRNKPSLSIVNPLDVLRQRLLLEIARRQMKENSRQVELNRAILKNVGKRVLWRPAGHPRVSRRYRQPWPLERELQLELERERERESEREREREDVELEQQEQEQLLLPWKHLPSQLWRYDWPQSPDTDTDTDTDADADTNRVANRGHTHVMAGQRASAAARELLSYAKKSLLRRRVNGNEANETNHEHETNENANGSGSKNPARYFDGEEEDEEPQEGVGLGLGLELGLERFDGFEDKPNWENEERNELLMASGGGNRGAANGNDRLPWSFPYRFHKSQRNVN
ncbi:uncharacterized protein LOC108098960 [Drosophila ficusphila]|uniref:uncharacterized protein LOC108098960 n=1 Tax=Drosophila ficusphila TaxID=30025 RepID=UPI0007E6021C|nr:uncharacterized protein LOC108098960 [Drosophila ficusphila]